MLLRDSNVQESSRYLIAYIHEREGGSNAEEQLESYHISRPCDPNEIHSWTLTNK